MFTSGTVRLSEVHPRPPALLSVPRRRVTLKSFIVLCNSLAIVFLQYDLRTEALSLLKQASQADLALYDTGSLLDRLWSGRVTTYNCLAYLFAK